MSDGWGKQEHIQHVDNQLYNLEYSHDMGSQQRQLGHENCQEKPLVLETQIAGDWDHLFHFNVLAPKYKNTNILAAKYSFTIFKT